MIQHGLRTENGDFIPYGNYYYLVINNCIKVNKDGGLLFRASQLQQVEGEVFSNLEKAINYLLKQNVSIIQILSMLQVGELYRIEVEGFFIDINVNATETVKNMLRLLKTEKIV